MVQVLKQQLLKCLGTLRLHSAIPSMDKYLHLCGCKTPLRYEGNYCRSSLQDKKTDFLGSSGGTEASRTHGLFLQLFLGGLREGHGAAGFGCWRGCRPTAPLREFKHASTDFLTLQFLGHGCPQ